MQSSRFRRMMGSLFLSLALSVFTTGLLIRLWPADVLERLRSAWAWKPLALYASIALAGALLRTFRYAHLLQPARPPFLPLFLTTLVRNFTVDLLPMRLGSLSFPALVHYRLRIPWPHTWSAYAWAIVWDFVSLALFLWVTLLALPASTPGYHWLALLPLTLTVASLALLFAPRKTLALILQRLFRRRHHPLFRPLKQWLYHHRHFWHGLLTVTDTPFRTRSSLVLIESLAIRTAKYAALFTLYHHYLNITTHQVAPLPFAAFIWTLTFAEMTAALPVQGLMNIGPWEFAWSFAMTRFNAHQPAVSAVLSTLVHWSSQLWEYAIGALALGLLFLMPRRPVSPEKTIDT